MRDLETNGECHLHTQPLLVKGTNLNKHLLQSGGSREFSSHHRCILPARECTLLRRTRCRSRPEQSTLKTLEIFSLHGGTSPTIARKLGANTAVCPNVLLTRNKSTRFGWQTKKTIPLSTHLNPLEPCRGRSSPGVVQSSDSMLSAHFTQC